MKKIILLSLVVILLSGCSFIKKITNEPQIIGGDKDEHGCLIGAGYQYCPSTEKCQRMWEEYCEEFKDTFKVLNFEDCVEAGNPILKTNPAKCQHGEEIFIEGERFSQTCGIEGANWVDEYSECEYVPQDWCEQMGGQYLECESACRHDDAEICTMQCVPVCKFKNGDQKDVYAYKDLIKLEYPGIDELVSSPLVVKGEARGMWFFEGDFPVILTNWDGLIIAEGIAKAKTDWMTEEYVSFEAELKFEKPEFIGDFSRRGSLILQKDNPSGLSENDDALEITIFFE